MPSLADRARTRIRSIFSSQKRRAAKHGETLPYTADELVEHLLPLGKCPYCSVKLTPKGFQVDHVLPLALGGSWALDNLRAVCTSDNRRKHALHDQDYRALLDFLETRGDYTKRNVLARLAAGGAWLAGRF